MKKNILIDSATAPDGGKISLYTHDGSYAIKVDGIELMSTRQNHSERVLAEVTCSPYRGKDIDVLVGGLGFGFTLESVLSLVSTGSKVVVAELMDCIIKWNSDEELPLAHSHLADNRVRVVQGDVGKLLKNSESAYDAILMDVDNGPEAFTTESNNALYDTAGLEAMMRALKRGGTLGIWSATPNEKFERLMKRTGFNVETVKARARPKKGAVHHLFIGTKKN